jgi:CSLREA domain-containing protein
MNTTQIRKSTFFQFLVLVLSALLLAMILTPASAAPDATITVNSTADNDVSGDGLCTLREAIDNANDDADTTGGDCTVGSGADTIILPAGTYTFVSSRGDLDILSTITINGDGAGSTIIQAGTTDSNGIDRVFDITSSGHLILASVTVRHGKVTDYNFGGGIRNDGGTVIIKNCTISNNSTNGGGGGIYIRSGTVSIENSAISANSAGDQGGGVSNFGTLTIKNSILSGNSTSNNGGGLLNSAGEHSLGTVSIENSTISGNSADNRGGGIYNYWSSIKIAYSTITKNNSNDNGSGSGSFGGGIATTNNSTVTIKSSIVAHNYDNGLTYDDCVEFGISTINSQGYNVVAPFTGCPSDGTNDLEVSDPKLDPLAYNNGDTQTHALQWDSAARDRIPVGQNDCGLDMHSDQRGVLRPTGSYCDVGAYETGGVFWDGGGADNNWNTAANWSEDSVPATSDTVVFNSTSSKDAALNGNVTVYGVVITGGYGGTLTQGSYNLNLTDSFGQSGGIFAGGSGQFDVGDCLDQSYGTFTTGSGDVYLEDCLYLSGGTFSGGVGQVEVDGDVELTGGSFNAPSGGLIIADDFIQSGGTFAGGSGWLDIEDNFNLNGGTFSAPSGLMTVTGGFHHSGGTFDPNGGHVVLDNSSDQTLATTFHDLYLNDGLLGYWKLDEGTGTTIADSSGYGQDGGLQYDTDWTTDTPSTDFANPAALILDGHLDFVDITGTPEIDELQEFTIAAWVKLGSSPSPPGSSWTARQPGTCASSPCATRRRCCATTTPTCISSSRLTGPSIIFGQPAP